MKLEFLLEHLPMMMRATIVTIQLTLVTLVASTVFAIPLAIVRMREYTFGARMVAWYSALMRAVPTLVLLFFVYYGLPQIGVVIPAFVTALVGLSLSAIAYNLEIIRSGLMAVDRGQIEAARALGVPGWRIWWNIAIPQAVPVMVPTYLSNATLVLKGTSVASIITIPELTAVANEIVSETYRPFEILLGATAIYIVLGGVLTLAAQVASRQWQAK
ncbi:amino acid ABC transporter permease [Microvirga alba]|uniref:Amino acid ABC transporter permease n=1 Tax=Microvirga alba TaxID=2791025 RepID=A0A931FR90_9HYPH|nr:amino acid ABC transporter permease [Microvirga alba]MBF9235492.1 amino acid ABC transporter permease [Microvirga alba]